MAGIAPKTFLQKRAKHTASQTDYKSVAKTLRKYHTFGFDLRGNLTPNQKRAITLAARKNAGFMAGIKAPAGPGLPVTVKFIKASSKAELKNMRETFGANVVTSKGVWINAPATRGKATETKVTESFSYLKIGKTIRLVFPIKNPAYFLSHPEIEIAKLVREHGEPDKYSFTINGYAARNYFDYEMLMLSLHDYSKNDGIAKNFNGIMFIYDSPNKPKNTGRKKPTRKLKKKLL